MEIHVFLGFHVPLWSPVDRLRRAAEAQEKRCIVLLHSCSIAGICCSIAGIPRARGPLQVAPQAI